MLADVLVYGPEKNLKLIALAMRDIVRKELPTDARLASGPHAVPEDHLVVHETAGMVTQWVLCTYKPPIEFVPAPWGRTWHLAADDG